MPPELFRRALLLTAVFSLALATPALAQLDDLEGRFAVHVNGGFQSGTDTVRRTFVFRAYGEDARFDENHDTRNGNLLDLGGSIQVWEQVRVGASYSQLTKADSTRLTGTVPHPTAINLPRTIESQTLSLAHEQRATHLYTAWVVPINDKLDVAVLGGPSFFNLTQGIVAGVSVREVSGPPWPQVAVDGVTAGEFKKNAIGVHVGADVSYMATPHFGLGGFLRFAQGSVAVPSLGDDRPLNVGGIQVGGGVRLRF